MGVTAVERPEYLAQLKQLRLMDDDFMTKCFEDAPECVELVLRIVLDIPDLTVVESHTQVNVANLINRSLRLDVLASDSAGRQINVEIQRSDRGAGSRRARYHSSILDASLLESGSDFNDLPETWVIFITERDVMGRGRALYRVERCVLDTGGLFDDGAHILYVNGSFRDESPVGRLMHDFFCTDPADMHYDVLAERVRYFKESEEGNESMCRAMEDMKEEVREAERCGTAQRMLELGKFALEEIAQISNLPLDDVKRLAAKMPRQGGE